MFTTFSAFITAVIREFFHGYFFSPIRYRHFISLSRHSVRLMNERQSYDSQFKVVSQNSWLLKHWKIRFSYRQIRFNSSRRGRKPKCKETNQKLRIQWLWLKGISRRLERKSKAGSFATGPFWPWTWKISLVGKEKINNWEFWRLQPFLFF